MNIDLQYKDLVSKIYNSGYDYEDPNRKGVMRRQIDSYQFVHNFKDGFPVVGLRTTWPKLSLKELKVFLRGSSSILDLWQEGVNFWDKDYKNYLINRFGLREGKTEEDLIEAIKTSKKLFKDSLKHKEFENGIYHIKVLLRVLADYPYMNATTLFSLGRIYPRGMRNYQGEFDQITNLIKTLRNNPMATKKTIVMYNPAENKPTDKALSECHWAFEALVRPLTTKERLFELNEIVRLDGSVDPIEALDTYNVPEYGLTIKWHQHSVDTFLGLPTNIAYYANLCYALSVYCNLKPIGIIGDLSNVHLYDNSYEEVEELLSRTPELSKVGIDFPKYDQNDPEEFELFLDRLDQVTYSNYKPQGVLKVEMLEYSQDEK